MEASPAPGVAPAASAAIVNRNSMANPSGYGAGAPVRNFLNESVAGWIKRAMLAVWDAKPQYPLTWVGEYLISCDIKFNNAPATEAQKHFLYHSEGIKSTAEETATSISADPEAESSITAPAPTSTDVPIQSTSTPSETVPTITSTVEPAIVAPEVKKEESEVPESATMTPAAPAAAPEEPANGVPPSASSTEAADQDQEMQDV